MRERFAEVVRTDPVDVGLACALIAAEAEPDLDVREPLVELDVLAAKVTSADLGGLQRALGGFRGAEDAYDDLRSSLLHQVLRRGSGLPILLSVVWCEVAARKGVPCVPLNLPGHVMVAVDGVVVDPFDGGTVVDAAPEPELPPVDLLLRVLTNIRALAARQPRSLEWSRTQLWAGELSLLLPRHPLALRRERGELLVRLGDYVGGATQLEEYAELVEGVDDEAAAASRRQAGLARSRLN